MAVSPALRRLLAIRVLEEEQCQLALESALGELRRLEDALEGAAERDRKGRRLVGESARSGHLTDRLAGLEETRAAARFASVLTPRIASAELDAAELRQELLEKRVERRQAKTLIEETEAKEALEAARRDQRALDDWYLSRLKCAGGESGPAQTALGRPDAGEIE